MSGEFPFEIGQSELGPLRGRVRCPDSPDPVPAVVLVGGLFDRSEAGLWPPLGEALRARGLATIEADSRALADEARGFSRLTLGERAAELGELITAIFERVVEPRGRLDIRRLGVFGHGFGAAAALLRASEDSRIRALALASPVTGADALVDRQALDAWDRSEPARLEAPDGRGLVLGCEFERDWRRRGERFLDDAAEGLSIPVKILVAEDAPDAINEAARRLFFRQSEHAQMRSFRNGGAAFEGSEAELASQSANFFAEVFSAF